VARDADIALRNELLFRDANEQIAARRDELEVNDTRTPYLCECEDDGCTAIVRLHPEEYRQVRAENHRFVIVPGHPTIGEPTGLSGDGWVCVTKEGKM
jgi:hypothetical protein